MRCTSVNFIIVFNILNTTIYFHNTLLNLLTYKEPTSPRGRELVGTTQFEYFSCNRTPRRPRLRHHAGRRAPAPCSRYTVITTHALIGQARSRVATNGRLQPVNCPIFTALVTLKLRDGLYGPCASTLRLLGRRLKI